MCPTVSFWIPFVPVVGIPRSEQNSRDTYQVVPQPSSQGLSSYRPLERARGGKMRDPGNEVGGTVGFTDLLPEQLPTQGQLVIAIVTLITVFTSLKIAKINTQQEKTVIQNCKN